MVLFSQPWLCFPSHGSVFPAMALFLQPWFCFPSHGSVFSAMVLFSQPWLCFPKKGVNIVLPDTTAAEYKTGWGRDLREEADSDFHDRRPKRQSRNHGAKHHVRS